MLPRGGGLGRVESSFSSSLWSMLSAKQKETVDVSTRNRRRRTTHRTAFSTCVDNTWPQRVRFYPGCSEASARAQSTRTRPLPRKSPARCARTLTTNRGASTPRSVMPCGEEWHLKRRHLGHLRENRRSLVY